MDATHYGLQIVSLGAGIVAITLNIEQIMFTHNTKNYYSTSTLKYRMEKSTLTHSETNITLESNPLFDSYIAFAVSLSALIAYAYLKFTSLRLLSTGGTCFGGANIRSNTRPILPTLMSSTLPTEVSTSAPTI